jgi:hypothetical protein
MQLKRSWLKPTFIHTIEAVAVLGLAIVLANFFPEQRMEIGILAVGVFAFITKGLRASDSIVPDYVNGPK